MKFFNKKYGIYCIVCLFLVRLLLLCNDLEAQFYNGSQLSFGKNRVQYIDRFWSFYRFEDFDTYFYQQGKPLAIFSAKYFTEHKKPIEEKLQTEFTDKVQFVIFNKMTDLKQSNVGFISDDYYNIGGKTHIVGTKVFLYFNGDYVDFARQVRAGYAHVLINQSLYGEHITSQIKNSTLLSLPEWYLQGLISYISEEWHVEIDNYVRDGVMSGRYDNFYNLQAVEAAYAGHSFWHFITQKYGENVIPNILYMTRISRNVENGFIYVLGISYKTLINDWLNYYLNIYKQEEGNASLPDDKDLELRKYRKNTVYNSFKLSPDNNYLAYISNKMGRSKILLFDKNKNKTKRLLKQGHILDEKVDLSYPLMDWHPSGKILTILREEKGLTALYFYTPEDKKMEKRFLFHFDKVLNFSYSPGGRLMVVSAVINGKTNIYIYNVAANTFEVLTNDSYNDFDPVFTMDEKQIIFSSNRCSDTITAEKPDQISIDFGSNRNLYVYDYSNKSKILRKLTDYRMGQAIKPQLIDNNKFIFLSDINGIYNKYMGVFDSVISHIDTIIHYRYFAVINPISNYRRNICEHYINHDKNRYSELLYYNNGYNFYNYNLSDKPAIKGELPKTNYFKALELRDVKVFPNEHSSPQKDSMDINGQGKRKRLILVTTPDDTTHARQKVDIDNYVFTSETKDKDNSKQQNFSDTLNDDTLDMNYNEFYLPKQRNYMVEYTIDKMVNQLDFSYLNSSYQTFTGGKNPIYINPAFNALFKIGISDLLEDNRIVGGVRFSLDFDQTEYLLSYEMLRKRLDKQIIFYRQKMDNVISNTSILRNTSYMGYYILKYPLSNVLSLKGTTTYRYDNGVFLSTDMENLKKPNVSAHWGGLKGEVIFDNTRNQGNNIYFGSRYKIFAEYFKILTQKKSDLYVLGADFRHYQQIYKTLIWANRLAGSTSFGHHKLIYYMGGVDTWLFPKFNDSINVALDQNYAYQTLATNMRGFIQNIRNGSNFAVLNSELRLPFLRFFSKRPIKSEFLNSLQAITFFDVGTAWNGLSPYYKDNPFFTQVYESPFSPIKITVYSQKEPIVAGYGIGLRAKVLGYFLRADYAWGIEDGVVRKPVFYLSLSLDF